MAKTMEEFFEDLKSNEKGKRLFNAGKVETLDELVKVTGGAAAELGYRFSDEEILAYYNNQEALLKLRSDSIAQGLADIKDMIIAGASSECGARQIFLEPHCLKGPDKK